MGLSREERRVLQEIEERLAFEDPELDATLAGTRLGDGTGQRPPDDDDGGVPSGLWWALVVVAYVAFLIGALVVLTDGESPCPAAGRGTCQQAPAPPP